MRVYLNLDPELGLQVILTIIYNDLGGSHVLSVLINFRFYNYQLHAIPIAAEQELH